MVLVENLLDDGELTAALPRIEGLLAQQREQAELTRTLESAAATYRETSVDELLATMGEIAPVVITSTGPTSADRRGRLAVHFDDRRVGC